MKKFLSFLLSILLATSALTATARADGLAELKARYKIVEYMRAAATIPWTPETDIPYWNANQEFTFKAGVTYYGEPYTQSGRDCDYDAFRAQLKEERGRFVYTGPSTRSTYRGTDCSSTVSHAWREVSPDFPTLSTGAMLPGRQKLIDAVGSYQFSDERTTDVIVENNGLETMKAAYAELKPGDAVLTRRSTGHVMLVVQNDPENNRLFIIDQTGCANGVPKGLDGRSTFRLNHEISYDELFKSYYIPIRLGALNEISAE